MRRNESLIGGGVRASRRRSDKRFIGGVIDASCPVAQTAAHLVPELLRLTIHADGRVGDGLALPGGVQVAVARDGRATYARAFGFADASIGEPLTLRHRLKSASQSKVFSTVLALRLCEEGILSLDEPIWRFVGSWRLPEDRCGGWARQAAGITLRQLLSHTSGLSVRGFPQLRQGRAFNSPGPAAILDGCLGSGALPVLTFEPGTAVEYSGAGFTLVQLAIERSTGLSMANAAERFLLRPAGFGQTTFKPGGGLLPPGVRGHEGDGRPTEHTYYPALASSGAFSTAVDLACLFSAVARDAEGRGARAAAIDGQPSVGLLLSRPMASAALAPVSPQVRGYRFGLGFAIAPWGDKRVHKHAGWGAGHWCMTEGIVEFGTAVSVQCNMEEPRGKQVGEMLLTSLMERVWAAQDQPTAAKS